MANQPLLSSCPFSFEVSRSFVSHWESREKGDRTRFFFNAFFRLEVGSVSAGQREPNAETPREVRRRLASSDEARRVDALKRSPRVKGRAESQGRHDGIRASLEEESAAGENCAAFVPPLALLEFRGDDDEPRGAVRVVVAAVSIDSVMPR